MPAVTSYKHKPQTRTTNRPSPPNRKLPTGFIPASLVFPSWGELTPGLFQAIVGPLSTLVLHNLDHQRLRLSQSVIFHIDLGKVSHINESIGVLLTQKPLLLLQYPRGDRPAKASLPFRPPSSTTQIFHHFNNNQAKISHTTNLCSIWEISFPMLAPRGNSLP